MLRLGTYMMVIVILISCRSNSKNFNEIKYNVIQSYLGRKEVVEAIGYANCVLPGSSRMSANWLKDNSAKILVIIVQPDGLPFNTIAQSVAEDNIIFVSADWKKQCSKMFETFGSSATATPQTLALILLHETGHIVNYQPDSFLFGNLASLNLQNMDKMKYEIFADIYAINSLNQSKAAESDSLKKQLSFLEQEVEATYNWRYGLHGSPLSWMARDARKEFSDFSPSHPNMNLRFRIMGYYLNPTKEKLESIKWAIESRERDLPLLKNPPISEPGHLKNIPFDSVIETKQ